MRLIYSLIAFFAFIYSVLALHHAHYDQARKVQEIRSLSAEVKVNEPSLAFRMVEYKRFVYVH